MKLTRRTIKSPIGLIQEKYWPNQWKMMICCMLLNLTTRKQVDQIIDELFERWPTAKSMSMADEQEVSTLIQSLGLANKRSKSLIRMSSEWIHRGKKDPIKIHGIGQYARDAYSLFVEGKIPKVVNDHKLKDYAKWAKKAWKNK